MKLTPWFSGDQKPHRVGVYRRDFFGTDVISYSHWNGKFWGFYSAYAADAAKPFNASQKSSLQNLPWRGVMK